MVTVAAWPLENAKPSAHPTPTRHHRPVSRNKQWYRDRQGTSHIPRALTRRASVAAPRGHNQKSTKGPNTATGGNLDWAPRRATLAGTQRTFSTLKGRQALLKAIPVRVAQPAVHVVLLDQPGHGKRYTPAPRDHPTNKHQQQAIPTESSDADLTATRPTIVCAVLVPPAPLPRRRIVHLLGKRSLEARKAASTISTPPPSCRLLLPPPTSPSPQSSQHTIPFPPSPDRPRSPPLPHPPPLQRTRAE